MDLSELAEARRQYRYVPARLILANGSEANFSWGALSLRCEMPSQQIWDSAEGRSNYSSIVLDDYHRVLLNSDTDEAQLHGLASAVFWGYASGSNHKLNKERALTRVHWLKRGKSNNARSQPIEQIVDHIRVARTLLRLGDVGGALTEMMKIKFLGMSFASKILMFVDPAKAVVYDSIISDRLKEDQSAELRAMHVPTAGLNRIMQAQKHEQWCTYCSSRAAELNSANIRWSDWDKQDLAWRAVDVERAFFAMGR